MASLPSRGAPNASPGGCRAGAESMSRSSAVVAMTGSVGPDVRLRAGAEWGGRGRTPHLREGYGPLMCICARRRHCDGVWPRGEDGAMEVLVVGERQVAAQCMEPSERGLLVLESRLVVSWVICWAAVGLLGARGLLACCNVVGSFGSPNCSRAARAGSLKWPS